MRESNYIKVKGTEHVFASALLERIVASMPTNDIRLDWLFANLRQRSFGMIMLLLGLIAILPGICVLAGVVLVTLSIQMMMGREIPKLPRFIASRPLPKDRFVSLTKRIIPVIKASERFIRPRWKTPSPVTGRVVGFIVLLLAAALFIPVPLSNVVPGVLIILVALAYLEKDGLLLSLVSFASFVSLAVTLAEIWGTIEGVLLLFRG